MNGRSFGFVSSFSRCFSRISGPHGSGSDKNASLLAASDHSHVSHRSVSCFVVCVHPESEGGAACFTASGENTHTHTHNSFVWVQPRSSDLTSAHVYLCCFDSTVNRRCRCQFDEPLMLHTGLNTQVPLRPEQ